MIAILGILYIDDWEKIQKLLKLKYQTVKIIQKNKILPKKIVQKIMKMKKCKIKPNIGGF